jgi:hypothetical protein
MPATVPQQSSSRSRPPELPTIDLREFARLSVEALLRQSRGWAWSMAYRTPLRAALHAREAALRANGDVPLAFLVTLARELHPALAAVVAASKLEQLLQQRSRTRIFSELFNNEAVQSLSDDEYARLMTFVRAAMDMGVGHAQTEKS